MTRRRALVIIIDPNAPNELQHTRHEPQPVHTTTAFQNRRHVYSGMYYKLIRA